MIKFKQNKDLPSVLEITPEIFYDFRGEYVETFNEAHYKDLIEANYKIHFNGFVQDDISTSTKHILRGLHGDFKTWKLIQCLKGTILVGVICVDTLNECYLKSTMITLNDKERKVSSIYISK